MTRSIRSRLLFGQGATILVLILACMSSLSVARGVRDSFAHVVRTDDALIANVTLRAKLMDDEETGLRGYLLVRDPSFLQPYTAAEPRLRSLRRQSLQLAAGDVQDIALLHELGARAGRWEDWARRMLVAPVGTGRLYREMLTGKHLFDAYRGVSAAVLRDVTRQRAAALTSADGTVRTMSVLLAALFVLAVIGAVVAGLWTIRGLERPLVRLTWLADRVAEGDLSAGLRMEPIRELVPLTLAMERMRLEIRGQRHLATVLASSLQPDDLYRTFSEALRQHLHPDRLSVNVVGPGPHEMTTVYSSGDGADQVRSGQPAPIAESITSRAYQTGRPVLRTDLLAVPEDDLFDDERDVLAAGIRSLAVIPLMTRGRVVATVTLGSQRPNQYTDFNLGPILTLAPMVASAIVNAQLYESLTEAKRELEQQHDMEYTRARQDALTKLGNRLRLDEDLSVVHARSQRYGHTYSLVLCDVDHFKAYNDHYGHPAGDAVLAAVAGALSAGVRHGDAVYRYGGEEFLIILPEQEEEAAVAAAERVRAAVEALALPHEARPDHSVVTVSAGVATLHGGQVRNLRDIVDEADAALYRAKADGRNCVVSSVGSTLRVVGRESFDTA